jgi:predicted transglutaminase-like cysteine proteinase
MLRYSFLLRFSFLYLLLGFFSLSFAYTHPPWGKSYFEHIERAYGEAVLKRARRLDSLIQRHAGRPIEEKLDAVNKFFNEVQYVSDLVHWGKADYWQTPLETLVEFKGDCEDIAIAKYAALKAMGVPDQNLALVNVRVNGAPHMLLAFFQSKNADPLILDNTSNVVMKASSRTGLIPLYCFNSTSLWLTDRQMRKFGKVLPVPPSHKLVLNFS